MPQDSFNVRNRLRIAWCSGRYPPVPFMGKEMPRWAGRWRGDASYGDSTLDTKRALTVAR